MKPITIKIEEEPEPSKLKILKDGMLRQVEDMIEHHPFQDSFTRNDRIERRNKQMENNETQPEQEKEEQFEATPVIDMSALEFEDPFEDISIF